MYLMKGTPYIYQGEELGMTNAGFDDLSQYRDLESLNAYDDLVNNRQLPPDRVIGFLKKISRDNARTPMQWNDSENAGFTTGTPWIDVNRNYRQINAEKQLKDPQSIFHFYRKVIELRHEEEAIAEGKFEMLLEESEQIFAYRRTWGDVVIEVICNFTPNHVKCDIVPESMEFLLGNYEYRGSSLLKPYEALVYKR